MFTGVADFRGVTFTGTTKFEWAIFSESADINDDAKFSGVTFAGLAVFLGATFKEFTWFDDVTFMKGASFQWAKFNEITEFSRATFTGVANFKYAAFASKCDFDDVTFRSSANFSDTVFTQTGDFRGANFTSTGDFSRVTFSEDVHFGGAIFTRDARFSSVTFTRTGDFRDVTFTGAADFNGATFSQTMDLSGASFARIGHFGGSVVRGRTRLQCAARHLDFSGCEVSGELVIEGAIARLEGQGMRSSGRVALRLRGTEVEMDDAVFTGLFTIHGLGQPLDGVEESYLPEGSRTAAVVSLRGVDAERLVLTDVDLSRCRFAGIERLDQIVLDGQCIFDLDPAGTRQVLAEEHHWRHKNGASNWILAPDTVEVVGPARLQVLYRQLRKNLEEGKNEPGAADFYYGEMEMRRATAQQDRRPDRWLLSAYWATSGYALRVRRALVCLALVIVATIIALTVWGFPATGADLKADGTLTTPTGGQQIVVTIHQSDPARNLGIRIGEGDRDHLERGHLPIS